MRLGLARLMGLMRLVGALRLLGLPLRVGYAGCRWHGQAQGCP